MEDDDKIKPFPAGLIVRSPKDVKLLKIGEELLRDPRLQQMRIPIILEIISQVRWFRNVEQMERVRKDLPKKRGELGALLVGTEENDWKNNPLYYWVLCNAYRDAMKEERIASSDDPADSDTSDDKH